MEIPEGAESIGNFAFRECVKYSWEGGSNEYGNKMMRKYFSKWCDFKDVTDKQIIKSTNRINFSIRRIH